MASLLLALLSLSAFAPSLAYAAANIDKINGCGRGKAEAMAKAHCSDYRQFPVFIESPNVKKAYKSCLKFYEVAHQVANVFCSYDKDSGRFAEASMITAGAEGVGAAHRSEASSAQNYKAIVETNDEYLKAIGPLADQFRAAYQDYNAKIGRINGEAGTNEVREAQCVLSLTLSRAPGLLLKGLVELSHANISETWDHTWPAVRKNWAHIKKVRDLAKNHASTATGRGESLAVEIKTAAADPGKAPEQEFNQMGSLEGIAVSQAQQHLEREIAKRIPKLPAPGAAIIGGGIILAYKYYRNQEIDVVDTGVTLVQMFSGPVGGLALSVYLAYGQDIDRKVLEYRKVVEAKLKENQKLTNRQLGYYWGQHTKSPACQKQAMDESACDMARSTEKKYEVTKCTRAILPDNN